MARLVAEDGSSVPVPARRGGPAYLSDGVIRLRKVPAGRWRYVEPWAPLVEFTVRPGVANEVQIQE